MQALSALPVTSSSAFDINTSGQVLGRYTITDPADGSTRVRAFVATPVTALFNKLLSLATGVGPGQSLVDKINAAQASYAAQDVPGTCSILSSFSNEVDAQSGKHVDVATAAALLAEVAAIRVVLGCG